MIVFDVSGWQLLQLAVTILLPLVVGLVNAKEADPARKALWLAGLSILTSLGTELLDAVNAGDPYNLGAALVSAVFTFLLAVGTYFGFWKPTRIADKVASLGYQGKHELAA